MNLRNRTAAIAAAGVILVAGVGLSACGSDSDSEADDTTTSMESTAAAMVMLSGEDTYLVLDSGTATVLTDNGVAVAPAAPAEAAEAGIAFPITGEEVDAATLASGVITHTGGLTFTAGGTELTVSDFSVDLSTGVLTATLPDGATLPLLNLDLSQAVATDTSVGKDVKGVTGALTADAATALNATFGVEFFAEGLAIGTLDLTMVAAS